MGNKEKVFISWTYGASRRTDSLAQHIGFKIFRFSLFPRKPLLAIVKYPIQFFATFYFLLKKRPKIVAIEFCTPIVGILGYIYKLLFKKPYIIDLHSGPIVSKKWLFLRPFTNLILSKSDAVILHEETIQKKIQLKKNQRYFILNDPPIPVEGFSVGNSKTVTGKEYFVFPASGDSDEPIDEIIKTANLIGNFNFLITGNVRRTHKNMPKNLIFTGYLSHSEYYSVIKNAKAIISLTKWEYTLTCSSLEGLVFEKPVIVSNKEALKNFFKNAAIYVENRCESIVEGIKKLNLNYSYYSDEVKKLKREYVLKWDENLKLLKSFISSLEELY
ncbi:MAG: glycosyltransferase [Candidatus Hydrothermales bacterium]